MEEDVRFPVLDTRVLVQSSCNLTIKMPSLLAFDNANFPEVKCHMEAFSDLNSSPICSSSVQLVSLEQLKSHEDQQMVVTDYCHLHLHCTLPILFKKIIDMGCGFCDEKGRTESLRGYSSVCSEMRWYTASYSSLQK